MGIQTRDSAGEERLKTNEGLGALDLGSLHLDEKKREDRQAEASERGMGTWRLGGLGLGF